MNRPVVFYDGDCPFCTWAILLLIRHDHDQRLRYASLNGEMAKVLLSDDYPELVEKDTIVYTSEGRHYTASTAVLMALRTINKWPVLVNMAFLTPVFIRDNIYRKIADNRRKLIKKCPMIPVEYRHLFLDKMNG